MKIAYVNTEFFPVPPVRGGAVEEWIEQSARQLKDDEIVIFSIYHEALGTTPPRKDHIRYFWYKQGLLAKILMSTYKLPFKNPDSQWFYFFYACWCGRAIKKLGAEIIHIHNRPHFAWILRKLNPTAKIIMHFHQVSAMTGKPAQDPKFPQGIDLFMGCSKFITEEIQRRFNVPESKTRVAYNALDLNDFPHHKENSGHRKAQRFGLYIKDDEIAILYVGRLAENKGVHLLIEAANDLIQEGHNIKVIICGAAGYSNSKVTSYVQKLYDLAYTHPDRFIFTGFVPHEKIADYYLACDLVVIPSEVDEGFCVVTIEALACGIAVVASNRGGMPEIIQEGTTGTLAEGPSIPSLKIKIKKFVSNREKFKIMAENGRKMVEEKFIWENTARTLTMNYKELLSHA
jgi:spore coat protein SA